MAASERVRPAGWLRRLGLLLAIAVGLLAFGPQPAAQAHAFLLSSNPADGAVLPAAPSQLRLQFSETVVVEVTRIDVVGADGSTVRPSHLRLTGNSADPEDPVELVGDLPALANGAFRVSWQTLSRDDLHRTAGVFVFGVGERVSPAGVSEPRPRAEEAALRWLLFLGLAGCLGGALAGRLAMIAPAVKRPLAATAKVSAAGAVVALLASWTLLAEQARVSGVAIGRLLTGSYGAHWMLREFGLLLLVIAAGIALSHRLRPVRLGCLIAGAALAALGSAELGHARSAGPTALLADGAHLVAAAVWSGTLACLVCLALVGSRAGDRSAAIRASLVGFGRPALCCVATILITGVYLSSTVVGSVDAALLTFYGRVLLVKIAIFGAIAVLGLVNHGRVRRPGRLPRASLFAEAAAAVLVLGLAAVLISSQPAREPQYLRASVPATVPVTDAPVADLQQALAIRPNLPGHNVALANVFDTRRPAPAPIAGVSITAIEVDGRTVGPVTAQRLPDGQWSAPIDLVSPGRAQVEITVRRVGLPDSVGSFSWVVGGAVNQSRPATVSNAPVAGLLGWLAAALLVLAGGLGIGWLAGHRRRSGAEPALADPVLADPTGREPDRPFAKAGTGPFAKAGTGQGS